MQSFAVMLEFFKSDLFNNQIDLVWTIDWASLKPAESLNGNDNNRF